MKKVLEKLEIEKKYIHIKGSTWESCKKLGKRYRKIKPLSLKPVRKQEHPLTPNLFCLVFDVFPE